MVLKRIASSAHPMYREALELYRASFPYHEQRESRSQEEILMEDEYHFDLLYDGDVFVGLVLYWEQEGFIYIEHFCILPEMRNRQYGQKTLALLAQRGKTVILEIDPPEDAVSKRRKGFYERCGFVENAFAHTHPPYHKGAEGHRLVVMTQPGPIPRELFEAFRRYLENRVMGRAF